MNRASDFLVQKSFFKIKEILLMTKSNYSDKDCRETAERLLSAASRAPKDSCLHLFDKTLLDFSIPEQWMDFQFVVGENHLNVIGTVHGGVMAGIADECMGFGAASLLGLEDEVITTSDMQFNCMKAIYLGDVLRVHIILRHAGKRSLITTAEIYRGEDLVFMATEREGNSRQRNL